MEDELTTKKAGLLAILLLSLLLPNSLEATIYGRIEGIVIAEDTGKGLKGVLVRIFQDHPQHGIIHLYDTDTDDFGRFSFRSLKEGTYFIVFSPAPPYYGDESWIFSNPDGLETLKIDKGTIISNYLKILKVGGTISGRILEGDGISPLRDTEVTIMGPFDNFDAKTDENGNYAARGLPPGQSYKILAYKPGYWVQTKKDVAVDAGRETSEINIIIDLNDPTSLEGQIILPEGEGADFIAVHVYNEDQKELREAKIYNYEKYSLVGLEPGKHIIFGYYKKIKIIKEINIIKGVKNIIDLDFRESLSQSSSYSKDTFFLPHGKAETILTDKFNNIQATSSSDYGDFPCQVETVKSPPPDDVKRRVDLRAL